ncbi:CPBP family intramembrane glutamic endopeptidase [Pedobacter sp. JY14-1]|uniref:CPBP family intramembrane glutamic endopeptidase n=1 Tax=Pedobacter sp. JY14-1 TaxID=3034151 RepID=UPI0023E143E5|nr:CPBP family intramembrane glutamic endopeptidase [Pedobacter sp. JY14-1]
MKTNFQSWPAWLKVCIYFIVLWATTMLGGVLPPDLNNPLFYLLAGVLVSWLMLRAEGKRIGTLGFIPQGGKDYRSFAMGAGLGALLLITVTLLTLTTTGDRLVWLGQFKSMNLVVLAFFTFVSAFAQEFVFRGYPFQLLLTRYPVWLAQLLVAIPFGLMHISLGMRFSEIGIILLTTGTGSVLFGLAYLRTGRLFFPTGIHMGWNLLQGMLPRAEQQGGAGLFRVIPAHHLHQDLIVVGVYLAVMWLAIVLMGKDRLKLRGKTV